MPEATWPARGLDFGIVHRPTEPAAIMRLGPADFDHDKSYSHIFGCEAVPLSYALEIILYGGIRAPELIDRSFDMRHFSDGRHRGEVAKSNGHEAKSRDLGSDIKQPLDAEMVREGALLHGYAVLGIGPLTHDNQRLVDRRVAKLDPLCEIDRFEVEGELRVRLVGDEYLHRCAELDVELSKAAAAGILVFFGKRIDARHLDDKCPSMMERVPNRYFGETRGFDHMTGQITAVSVAAAGEQELLRAYGTSFPAKICEWADVWVPRDLILAWAKSNFALGMQVAVIEVGARAPRKKSGGGFDAADAPLIAEGLRMVSEGMTVNGAAIQLAPRAKGAEGSKARRLGRKIAKAKKGHNL